MLGKVLKQRCVVVFKRFFPLILLGKNHRNGSAVAIVVVDFFEQFQRLVGVGFSVHFGNASLNQELTYARVLILRDKLLGPLKQFYRLFAVFIIALFVSLKIV